MLLEDFPPEILARIVDYVGVNAWKPFLREMSDLRPLSLCSRKFSALVRPVLFEALVSSKTLSTVVHRFITKTPTDVSIGVKQFVTYWLDRDIFDPDSDSMLSMALFSEADFTACNEIIQEIYSSQEKATNWMEKLRSGHYDALAGLTVALFPNLKYIELSCWYMNRRDNFIVHILDRAARLQNEGRLDERGTLAKLRGIWVGCDNDEGGINLDCVSHFIKPKSVNYVFLSTIDAEILELGDDIFHAEELMLDRSAVDADCLIQFPHCFPILKSLTYEASGSTVGYAQLIVSKMGQTISHLEECLEVLNVTNPNEGLSWDRDDMLPVGSLAGFKKLKELTINSKLLLGDHEWGLNDERRRADSREGEDGDEIAPREYKLVDVIPKSLRKLVLERRCEYELEQLLELTTRKDEVASELAYIHFNYEDRNGRNRPGEDEIEPVMVACDTVGIELDININKPNARAQFYYG